MISVCIPTYEMHGKAEEFLTRSFDILLKQTYKDFEVVISDNSENDAVKNLCENPKYKLLNIKYMKNPIKGASANTNNAIKNAGGQLIKILYMDDFLSDENSLKDIVDNFKGYWLVTGCKQEKSKWWRKSTHIPYYNKDIYWGKNTIGGPSVLTIKNDNPLMFDENLKWLFDCDYYRRLYDKYGEPEILNKVNVVIGVGAHQETNNLSNKIKKSEEKYTHDKYDSITD